MRKYVRKNSNQVHRGNATIWQNHRMMRVAMKNMMVLPVKFGRSLGEKWQRKVEIWLNAVYAMNISGQNDKTKNILLMMIFFFFFFCSICIGSKILRSDFDSSVHSGVELRNDVIKLYRNAPNFYTGWKSFIFFLCDTNAQIQKLNYGVFFICVVSFHENLPKRNFYFHLAFTCSNQSQQTKHKNKACVLWGDCLYFRNYFIQMCAQNSVKHLRF